MTESFSPIITSRMNIEVNRVPSATVTRDDDGHFSCLGKIYSKVFAQVVIMMQLGLHCAHMFRLNEKVRVVCIVLKLVMMVGRL